MKVKDLIKVLKTMPQNLQVGIAEHDNSEWEASGWVNGAFLFEKDSYLDGDYGPMIRQDIEMLKDMPETCVIIRG